MKIRLVNTIAYSFLLLGMQQIVAENPPGPNFDNYGYNQMPITWGDCIPVPVESAAIAPIYAPAPFFGNGSMPMMAPTEMIFPPAPPVSYFELRQMPAPTEATCDDSSSKELATLQSRYGLAAAASKNKIKELHQALSDTQNQMTDSRDIIERLSKEQQAVEAKLKELELSKANMKVELSSATDDAVQQQRKLTALSQSTIELGVMKESNKKLEDKNTEFYNLLEAIKEERGSLFQKLDSLNTASTLKNAQDQNIITALNKKIANFKDSNISLQTKLAASEKNIGDQARKVTALKQTAIQLTAMKSAYHDKNNDNAKLTESIESLQTTSTLKSSQDESIIIDLKKKLKNYDDESISLKTKLSSFEKSSSEQVRKITVLVQSASELTALQSAYKELNTGNEALQKHLGGLENMIITLKTELATAEKSAGSQARRLTVLGQSATELTALKSAYKERNDETDELRKKLKAINDTNITLQTKLSSAEKNSGAQTRKLTALGQSATELTALKSVYKERNDETDELRKKLKALNDTNITLQTKLSSAEKNSGAQARKLTALGQSATELTALQSAYKERNDEVAMLEKKLTNMDSLQIVCTLKSAQDDSTIDGFKKKLMSLDSSNKSLIAKLSTAEANSGAQARKLTSLSSTVSELLALKSAYKERNEEAHVLESKLDQLTNSLDIANASKAKATQLTNELAISKEKSRTLKSELTQLKNSLDIANTCKSTAQTLKNQLAASEDQNKSLLAKITSLENTSSEQTREINSLMMGTKEFEALKSAYKELNSKKAEIAIKLDAATADQDNDGVLNTADKCPNTPTGVEVNTTGCVADTDNDGVANNKDNCPISPQGSSVNEVGCPKIVDGDGDSVADANDLCPDTNSGVTVNEFGCTATENITLEGVNFATGSARLTSSSLPILTAAAETLKKSSSLNAEISGYTDNQGSAVLNKSLSQRRANTVMIQLIKDGVNANNLTAKGYGEESPIATNDTEEGRATNRRVELKIR